jgi:hypothetical protein
VKNPLLLPPPCCNAIFWVPSVQRVHGNSRIWSTLLSQGSLVDPTSYDPPPKHQATIHQVVAYILSCSLQLRYLLLFFSKDDLSDLSLPTSRSCKRVDGSQIDPSIIFIIPPTSSIVPSFVLTPLILPSPYPDPCPGAHRYGIHSQVTNLTPNASRKSHTVDDHITTTTAIHTHKPSWLAFCGTYDHHQHDLLKLVSQLSFGRTVIDTSFRCPLGVFKSPAPSSSPSTLFPRVSSITQSRPCR